MVMGRGKFVQPNIIVFFQIVVFLGKRLVAKKLEEYKRKKKIKIKIKY